MRAGVMSTGFFGIATRTEAAVREQGFDPCATSFSERWSEETFAEQQLRSLVRQVFFSGGISPIRHVAFSAVDRETDLQEICERVSQTLVSETGNDVALATTDSRSEPVEDPLATSLRAQAVRLDQKLWRLIIPPRDQRGACGASLKEFMERVRREFAYSIVIDSDAAANDCSVLAEFADGVVLVVSALRTRRAAARRRLEELSHVRLLGTVLEGREFPVPEKIYRRL